MKRLLKLKKKKKTDYKLFKNYFTNYQSLSDMYKKLCDTGGKKKKKWGSSIFNQRSVK